MILAFSTCWNSSRHKSGDEMLREIVEMGFDHVELSHGLGLQLMEGILKFCARGGITVTSLHNFCPQPVEIMGDSPDCYEFSAAQPEASQRAVKMTLQTLDYAERLGARRVVLHLGTVDAMRDTTRGLMAMVQNGQYLSKKFAERKLRAVIEREKASAAVLARVEQRLEPIVKAAERKGIRLGLENRDAYECLPSERELPSLLDRLAPVCGYWHDFGHAQRKENLSLLNHEEWVAKVGHRAIGCHLHDTQWPFEDHLPPFSGNISFSRLVPHFPKDIPFVFELHPNCPKETVLTSVERWRKEFAN